MSDFRYNEPAEALEENLEEVLDSHKKEQEEKQASAAASAPTELSALERLVDGDTPADQVRQIMMQGQKKASDLIAEHRLRGLLQKKAHSRTELVDNFVGLADAQKGRS